MIILVLRAELSCVNNIFLKKYIHIMKALMISMGQFLEKSLSVAIDMTPKCNIAIAFSVVLLLFA